jgi:signal transduction histidine kinase
MNSGTAGQTDRRAEEVFSVMSRSMPEQDHQSFEQSADAPAARDNLMVRLNLAPKIGLRIGIFILGFIVFTVLAQIQGMNQEDRLNQEIPKAVAQSLDGVERVARIVRVKEFAHPGHKDKAAADLNKALPNALVVARNEFKYVADAETDLGELPAVVCHIAEMNQLFLNLLINAAHAIGEVVKGSQDRGKITVRTWRTGAQVMIAISDTGCGIPEAVRSKVFDPFFASKPVGRGTGQGLAIARSIVVETRGGSLTFEPNGKQGTTFLISLPVQLEAPDPAELARTVVQE